MKLRAAFQKAKIYEITWYARNHDSGQLKISVNRANKEIKPLYNDFLDDLSDNENFAGEHFWYGHEGEIIASYCDEIKSLTLGC